MILPPLESPLNWNFLTSKFPQDRHDIERRQHPEPIDTNAYLEGHPLAALTRTYRREHASTIERVLQRDMAHSLRGEYLHNADSSFYS